MGKEIVTRLLLPRGKISFLYEVVQDGTLLDVGCGNDSPLRVKGERPDIVYYGIDVCDYRQSKDITQHVESYTVTTPELFAEGIACYRGFFDAVICSHNLEHCDDPDAVLLAISGSMKAGGKLYLSFPCEESVNFPSRAGCLNYHDDPTHKGVPDFSKTVNILKGQGFRIDFSVQRHRPPLLFLLGFFLEPLGMVLKQNMPLGATWSYYGFESVIWVTCER